MSSDIGSRLASLANAKKQAEDDAKASASLRAQTEADRQKVNLKIVEQVLCPHVTSFNNSADNSLKVTLQLAGTAILIKRSWATLLTLDVTDTAVILKRNYGSSSSDYYTIKELSDGSVTFNGDPNSARQPNDANTFAERVLTESLGLGR